MTDGNGDATEEEYRLRVLSSMKKKPLSSTAAAAASVKVIAPADIVVRPFAELMKEKREAALARSSASQQAAQGNDEQVQEQKKALAERQRRMLHRKRLNEIAAAKKQQEQQQQQQPMSSTTAANQSAPQSNVCGATTPPAKRRVRQPIANAVHAHLKPHSDSNRPVRSPASKRAKSSQSNPPTDGSGTELVTSTTIAQVESGATPRCPAKRKPASVVVSAANDSIPTEPVATQMEFRTPQPKRPVLSFAEVGPSCDPIVLPSVMEVGFLQNLPKVTRSVNNDSSITIESLRELTSRVDEAMTEFHSEFADDLATVSSTDEISNINPEAFISDMSAFLTSSG